MSKDYKSLEKQLTEYIEKRIGDTQEVKYTASIFLKWLERKTKIIDSENSFSIPTGVSLKRGDVVWVEFGFNIGDEFGGKHPAITMRVSGRKIFVIPVSSQTPKVKSENYVKVDRIYDFPYKTRWVNVLNLTGVSIQRVDFDSKIGRVNVSILDKIGKSIQKAGIK